MLFPSPVFLFAFLPVVLTGFLLLRHVAPDSAARAFLVLASLVFYGWASPPHLLILVASILINYAIGHRLLSMARTRRRGRATLLALGVTLNLAALVYFKYVNFLVGEISTAFGLDIHLAQIVLPIGISFYTFQQIAFLVDAWKHDASAPSLLDHALFISFFPQLIAGPIVHHKEMMPQFRSPPGPDARQAMAAAGVVYFTAGLFKKIALADAMATFAGPVFDAAEKAVPLTPLEGWIGALSYTLQIYFDFSAYSDMALGLGLFFGILLPINFNSPYKAASIIDFWQRWHITLSRFLRDYLYIPLGGNRRGVAIRYRNIFLVMLIGGIWHGAGWTFVIWGLAHGAFIIANHAWRDLGKAGLIPRDPFSHPALARGLTLIAVIAAWVFFRAETVGGALHVLSAMFGVSGVSLPAAWLGDGAVANAFAAIGVSAVDGEIMRASRIHQPLILIALLFSLCFLAPNTHVLARFGPIRLPAIGPLARFAGPNLAAPTAAFAVVLALAAWFTISLLARPSPFIYFQF